jgi:DNA-binding response OmpR family regulator
MNTKRLLIIDDEPDFGQYVCGVAEGMNFNVRVTTQAPQFKEAYENFDPTVIVLDVIMPETDGIELVNWLAEQHFRGALIVVTGFTPHYASMASTLSVAKGLVSAATLFKPIGLVDLRAALTRAILSTGHDLASSGYSPVSEHPEANGA